MNNLDYDHIPIPINRDSEDIIRKSKGKIERICIGIMKRNKTSYKVIKIVFFYMMKSIDKLIQTAVIKELKVKAQEVNDSKLQYFELIPLTDKSIVVDEKCTSCGICAKICPVDNIKIVNQKPEFEHRCEMCFACDSGVQRNPFVIGVEKME
jgi:ferredoxin